MVHDDGEAMTKKILPPLLDGGRNHKQLPDVCQSSEQFWRKLFTEEGYWMVSS